MDTARAKGRAVRRAVLLAIALALGGVASAEPLGVIDLTLGGPTRPVPGAETLYSGTLTVEGLVPLPGQTIRIRVDQRLVDIDTTDESGAFRVPLVFESGPHTIQAMVYENTELETAAELAIDATAVTDLSVSLVAPESVAVGATFDADAAVVNAGPNGSTATQLVVTIDGPATMLGATTGQGRDCDLPNPTEAVCPMGTVGAGAGDSAALVLRADAAGALVIDATVSATEEDTDPSNNAASAAIIVS